jgi:anti-sigma28 factor (negative regulator of flagellin synthesis)
MRYSNKAMNQYAGDDSMHAAAMAGMHLANEGRRKLDREAQAAQQAADGDVRFERVAKLRAAMAAGTYRVGSADVAAKLMGSMMR